MTARMRNWFTALSRREQWLVGVAAVLTAWIVVIFGIVLPTLATIDAARLELDEAAQRRGRIEASVEYASSQKPAAPQATGADIDLIVTQSAAEQGFDIIKSTGGTPTQIAFRIDQARAPALLAWLSGMEGQGIGVRSISLRSGASGNLAVEAQLQQVAK